MRSTWLHSLCFSVAKNEEFRRWPSLLKEEAEWVLFLNAGILFLFRICVIHDEDTGLPCERSEFDFIPLSRRSDEVHEMVELSANFRSNSSI